jgi:membrane-bound lytic murein transglycosylase D
VSNKETFAWTSEVNQAKGTGSEVATLPSEEKTNPVFAPIVETPPANTVDSTKNAVDLSQNLQPKSAVNMLPDSAEQKSENIVLPLKNKEHIVREGETLYGIAHAYHVGVMDLATWNNLSLQDGIRPGQLLKLSESQPVGD